MILGIGTDIMEVARIRKAFAKTPGLREDIFTTHEIEYCESKANKFQHYAARFAAKEALLKAIGSGLQFGIRFNQIEISNNDLGEPFFNLKDQAKVFAKKKGIKKILVSLAHVKDYATAMVIVEG
ncbi:MAG TPA: holo-[acyl-carrier-protein] synthase [Bacteroidales bacterium]|nr:holo-[acyl-carrier-protein] synthase [Bacteroidales bacterium]